MFIHDVRSQCRTRPGIPIIVKVDLRGRSMYDFLGILVEFVLPRMREFSVLGEMRYGMLGVVEKLSRGGGDASGAVLVRELARACCVEPCDSVMGVASGQARQALGGSLLFEV